MTEQRISSEYVYKGRILNLRKDTVKLDNGQTATREIIEHVDSVGIIAVDGQENILLVNQYRTPVNSLLLEIPAGCLEPGEKPESTVVRELREETGHTAGIVKKLGGFYLAPGYSNEYMHVYVAKELSYAPLVSEDTEGIELIREPVATIQELILGGNIIDCKSVAAILMFLSTE